jgi:hypothetical protein
VEWEARLCPRPGCPLPAHVGVAERGGRHPALGARSEEITFPTPMNSDGLKATQTSSSGFPARHEALGDEAQTVPDRGGDRAPAIARLDDLRSRYIKSCRLSDNGRQPHGGHVSQDCSEPGVGRR